MSSPTGSKNWTEKRRKLRAEERERKSRIAIKKDPQEAVRLMELEIKRLKKQVVDEAVIREEILKISHNKPTEPKWNDAGFKPDPHSPGVPTIFASDWHWGERIDPDKIGGVNKYDLNIAHARAHSFMSTAIDLLNNHVVNPSYPGIVLALGGDMLSGDIHSELKETNDIASLPALVDLWGTLTTIIKGLADEFGHVFVPCVVGNHGRLTVKPTHKLRTETNYDWLLYTFLDKTFENDDRVRFKIAKGADVSWNIFSHRYCMTHGDQFRGGDGQVGYIGPVIRGDLRKRSRSIQTNQAYDTLVLGHFHTLGISSRIISNGSLCGFNEYSFNLNFNYEPPQQALWITHPKLGITIQMPIKVDKDALKTYNSEEWCSWRV